MTIVDRLRIESAVQRYDFWLELRGVRGRGRKALRRELRGNLADASADVGTTQALFGIGSPKELAYAATETDAHRPRWSAGLFWAGVALGVALIALAWTAVVFHNGVSAGATPGREVSGGAFPWWGTTFTARPEGAGLGPAIGVENPWQLLALPALVFLGVARPWRVVRTRDRGRSPQPAR